MKKSSQQQQRAQSTQNRQQLKSQQSKESDHQLSKITEAFIYNRASNLLVKSFSILIYKFQSSFQERNWLKKHGKEDRIDFKDEQIAELRKYFSSLDGDGSGSIGLEELEDPLIALGLVSTREEVEKIIQEVDDDKSGQIEFKEFLTIMSSAQKGGPQEQGQEKSPIHDFFKKMSQGQLGEEIYQNMPFKLNVSQYRRRKILDAIMADDKERKDKGQKILQSFKRQLKFYKQQEKMAKGEDPNGNDSLDQIPNKENGVNPRNGFPKQDRIIKPDSKMMKPKMGDK